MHIKDNNLVLVITLKFADNNVKITTHDYSTFDHYLVIADIASAHVSHQPAQWRVYCAIKAINRAHFCRDLLNTAMFTTPVMTLITMPFKKESLLAILDQHAPIKRSSHQPTPYRWQDERIDKLTHLRRF